MIARIWRAIATPENVPHYVEHFQHSVLPELRALGGFREAYILQHPQNDEVEITVMTLWESMSDIRRFAGHDAETAVVAPAAQAVLRMFDTTVSHFDVLLNVEA